ncbi:hypothetical protein CNMCM8980_008596 [Aspergillus fumigatiaffinis]|uniref:Uncharacterized protein n=1 Tax=Aspergillus fumigatiaffinis TaxID=340414 RepID=A0A8H4M9N1_9EURO|nr:hypothetical protein CNMCM6805_008517 [Aspergillus fumigatiaffinis]KAF4246395.1 hypothetical protein CNMCM8980_008596 [Aspergillus fumigatiaffinis]
MSQRRTHDWNKERVVLDRRGSDGEYDVRCPRKAHPNERPAPSYYGPNFSDVANKRSASLAYGDIRHPVTPDRYGKRPQPYTKEVEDEYKEYKQIDARYKVALDRAAKAPNNTPMRDVRFQEDMRVAHRLQTEKRVAANSASAARSGFSHKYPWAYDGEKGKAGHAKTVKDYRVVATKAANAQAYIEKRCPQEY